MPRLSARFSGLPAYPLAHIPARKKALLDAGVDVIDLGAGDADLAPPAAAVERLREAAGQPALQRYGFGLGYVPFREAVSAWMQRRFASHFDPMTEVVPLLGSKEGLAHVAFAYLGPGDVAIVPDPAYQAYLGGTLLSDATPYVYPLRPRTQFLIDLEEIPTEIMARTRVLYLNYPNNPTAAIAPRAYLDRVVETCRAHDIVLVFDNAYSEMGFDGYVPPSIFEIDGARDVAIEFHSLSKTYNMTGWRCGWAVGHASLVSALAKVKGFTDTGQYMGIQAAGVAAIESWESFVPGNVRTFQDRRDAAVHAFRSAGFTVDVPQATMYLWMPLPAGIASATFADRLREEAGVIVLPGSGFGAGGEGFFRIRLFRHRSELRWRQHEPVPYWPRCCESRGTRRRLPLPWRDDRIGRAEREGRHRCGCIVRRQRAVGAVSRSRPSRRAGEHAGHLVTSRPAAAGATRVSRRLGGHRRQHRLAFIAHAELGGTAGRTSGDSRSRVRTPIERGRAAGPTGRRRAVSVVARTMVGVSHGHARSRT